MALYFCPVGLNNSPYVRLFIFAPLLVKYEKQFLIIGNQNAITYKEIFLLIKENALWLGCKNGDMSFKVPKTYEPRATRYWQDETGQKWRSMGNICWFTNIDHAKRHQMLALDLGYSYKGHEDMYPKYDNYDAINVDKTAQIPYDYDGVMGVPITFLDKYCHEQFRIIDLLRGTICGKAKYFRILIQGAE